MEAIEVGYSIMTNRVSLLPRCGAVATHGRGRIVCKTTDEFQRCSAAGGVFFSKTKITIKQSTVNIEHFTCHVEIKGIENVRMRMCRLG